MEPPLETTGKNAVKCAIFTVGDIKCGIDTAAIREISRNLEVTRIALAPAHVRGVINLRGDTVNLIDLRQILGLKPRKIDRSTRVIVVRTGAEDTGLLVDSVDDIVEFRSDGGPEPPPPHLRKELAIYLSGVQRIENELVAVLDVEQILKQRTVS